MNRAERRRQEREGIKLIEKNKTVEDYIHLYTLSMILAMDSERLSKSRIQKVLSKVLENAECMASGHINASDVEKMCAEVYGIEFHENFGKSKLYVNADGSIVSRR